MLLHVRGGQPCSHFQVLQRHDRDHRGRPLQVDQRRRQQQHDHDGHRKGQGRRRGRVPRRHRELSRSGRGCIHALRFR